MSTRPTSRKRSQSYRGGLYATLEAAVREGDEASRCCDEHGSSCAVGKENSRERGEASTMTPVSYPFPIVWSEEMTPSHLDSYHSFHSRSQPTFNDLAGERRQTRRAREPSTTRTHPPTHDRAHTGAATSDERPERHDTKTMVNVESLGCAGAMRNEEAPDACDASSSGKTYNSLPVPVASSSTVAIASEGDCTLSVHLEHAENPLCHSSAASPRCMAPNPSSGQTGLQAVLSTQEHSSRRAIQHQALEPPGNASDGASIAQAVPDSARSSQMSQATEMSLMVLSELPSQVHLEQLCHGDTWEESEVHHAETSLSERPRPVSPPHQAYDELPDGAARRSDASCVAQASKPRDNNLRLSGHHSSAVAGSSATIIKRATGARQHEEFTRALENSFSRQADESAHVGVRDLEGGSAERGQQGSPPARGGGIGAQQSDYVLVPREEVLPRCFLGQPAQPIAVLERHLDRARAGAPNGYITRVLELACHVLSQPLVCARISSRGQGVYGTAPGGAGPGKSCSDEQAEVVGVAGVVWEILRAGDTCSFLAGGKEG